MWYKNWFLDENYLAVYEHRDDREAEQMIDLIERTTGRNTSRRVLDLACGSGRHSISFARRGYGDVTGIDLSPTLLREANLSASELGFAIRFLERDMRDIPHERFDLAVNLFTSFGYFEKDEENEAVIVNVANSLETGGYFVIDFFNSGWVRKNLVAHDERLLPEGRRVEQTRWIEAGRVEKRVLIRADEEAQEFIESVRLYELADFERMFQTAGLVLKQVFGNYDGTQFDTSTSKRVIMFAQK